MSILHTAMLVKTLLGDGGGGTPGGVSKEYVDSQDETMLQAAHAYADGKLVVIDIESRGNNSFWTLPIPPETSRPTARDIINMVNAKKDVRLHFFDTVYNTGDQLYQYETTVSGVPYFRRNVISTDSVSRINIGVQFDGEVKFESIPFTPADFTNLLLNSDFRHWYKPTDKVEWLSGDKVDFPTPWSASNLDVKIAQQGIEVTPSSSGGNHYLTAKANAIPIERISGDTVTLSVFSLHEGQPTYTTGTFVYQKNAVSNILIAESDDVILREGTDGQVYIWVKRPCTLSGALMQVGKVSTIQHKAPINEELTKLMLGQYGELIQQLEDSKDNYTYVVVDSDRIAQRAVREILSDSSKYEGKLIEFLTNGENPSKCVATGRVMTTVSGDTYLITNNIDGTTTVWSQDSYEKHNFECRSMINEPIVDLDNFTIDVQGDAPYMASVRNAMNNPPDVSEQGVITVIAYSVDHQTQIYRDMATGSEFVRIVTGTADQHSFSTWKAIGATINDEVASTTTLWSSQKIDDSLAELQRQINELKPIN